MKKLWILPVLLVVVLTSCKNSENNDAAVDSPVLAQGYYGEEFAAVDQLTAARMEALYQDLQLGDTINVTFSATVNSVCKNKGCWMTLNLPDDEEDVMVKFRDYGFFVPKDIEEKEVVVQGKAFVTEVPVDEQQHYAEDKGATPEEVAAITQPKRTLSFLADGVLIKE